jgi:uncharacterized protein YkwD
MSGTRRVVCCLAACAVLVTPGLAHASAPPMVKKINKLRRTHGLPLLRYSDSLGRSSRRFAGHIVRANRFSHDRRIHASRRFRRLGEVLAYTRGWSIRRSPVIRGWMSSSTHRAVLLNPAYRYVGAGHVCARLGGRRATIWVAQLASR